MLVGSSVRADPDKNVHSLLAGDLKRPATMDQHSALSLGDICHSKLIGVRNRSIFVSLIDREGGPDINCLNDQANIA